MRANGAPKPHPFDLFSPNGAPKKILFFPWGFATGLGFFLRAPLMEFHFFSGTPPPSPFLCCFCFCPKTFSFFHPNSHNLGAGWSGFPFLFFNFGVTPPFSFLSSLIFFSSELKRSNFLIHWSALPIYPFLFFFTGFPPPSFFFF